MRERSAWLLWNPDPLAGINLVGIRDAWIGPRDGTCRGAMRIADVPKGIALLDGIGDI